MAKHMVNYIDTGYKAGTNEWLKAHSTGLSEFDTTDIIVPHEGFGSSFMVYVSKILNYKIPVTDAMKISHLLEPVIKNRIEGNFHNINISQAATLLRSNEYSWLLCTPDYYIEPHTEKVKDPYILETKTTHERDLSKWKNGVPAVYQIQVQQQLLVTGFNHAVLAVGFLRQGTYDYYKKYRTVKNIAEVFKDFKIFVISTDENIQEEIINATREFWFNHVAVETPPPLSNNNVLTAYPVHEVK